MSLRLNLFRNGLLWSLAPCLLACSRPVPEPRVQPVPGSTAAMVAPAPNEPGAPDRLPSALPPAKRPAVQLPPPAPKRVLVKPKRAPACQQAQRLIKRAEATMAEGWMRRSERLLDRADKLCGELAARVALQRTKLHNAGISTASGKELWAQSEAARAKGDHTAARRLASMAARRLQIELGAQAEVIDVSSKLSPRLISADGQWQVAESPHGVLLLSGELTPHRIFPGTRRGQVALSPDGKRIAISSGADVTLWDVESGRQLNKVSWANETPEWFGFVAQGKQLLMLSRAFARDPQLHLFDVATGDAARHGKLARTSRSFHGAPVAASPQQDWIAVSVGGGALALIDVKTLKPIRTLTAPPPAKKGTRSGLKRLVCSPSGKRIAAFSDGGKLLVWDTATGKLLLDHKGLSDWFGGTVAFTKNETRVLAPSGSFGRSLVEVEISSGIARRTYRSGGRAAMLATAAPLMLAEGRGSGLSLLKLSRDISPIAQRGRSRPSMEAIAAGAGQMALAYEVRSSRGGKIWIKWWDGAGRRNGTFSQKSYRAQLAFSADGQHLLATLGHGDSSIWPLGGGIRRPLPKLGSNIRGATLGLDGTVRAVSGPFTTKLFALAPGTSTWKPLLELKERPGAVWFSADGRTGVQARDQTARRISLGAERATATAMPTLAKGGRWLGLSGDGEQLYAKSGNALVRYEVRDPKVPPVVVKDNCNARHLAASYDGSTVMISCDYSSTHLIVAGQSKKLSLDDEPHVLTRDGGAWMTYDHGIAYAGRTDKPDQRVTLQLDPDAGASLITSPAGSYEIHGQTRDAFAEHLACRLGQRLYPLRLCEDIRYEDDLLARILVPEP